MTKKKQEISKLAVFVIIILAVVVGLNAFIVFWTNSTLKKRINQVKEEARPAELSLTLIKDATCEKCFALEQIVRSLKRQNVKINSKEVDVASSESQDLLKKYNINKVPLLLVEGEIQKGTLSNFFKTLGTIKDNVFISNAFPPYKDLNDNTIKGLVDLIMLKDSNCSDCYDVTGHKAILDNYGLVLQSERTVEINSSEGRELKTKYEITKIPTIILSDQASYYQTLATVWPQVGKIAPDGYYVFTAVEKMGTYKDLEKNKIIKPEEKEE